MYIKYYGNNLYPPKCSLCETLHKDIYLGRNASIKIQHTSFHIHIHFTYIELQIHIDPRTVNIFNFLQNYSVLDTVFYLR